MEQVRCRVIWKYVKKSFFVIDKKQKVLVLETKKENKSEDQNMSTLKTIGYNYDECRQTL